MEMRGKIQENKKSIIFGKKEKYIQNKYCLLNIKICNNILQEEVLHMNSLMEGAFGTRADGVGVYSQLNKLYFYTAFSVTFQLLFI
jgi:hypothetical protein